MVKIPSSPTTYPTVNEFLEMLLANVRESLGDRITGIYLHGSLANGGFDEHSDIDVIVMTRGSLPDDRFEALRDMHQRIARLDSPWALQLEVAYIPQDLLCQAAPPVTQYPHLDRGPGEVLHKMVPDLDWNITRHVLRERGIILTGPDPKTFLEPVPAEELRLAVRRGIPVWFTPILNDPSEISKRGDQAFFVLTTCRMLYTLEHGEILSKPAAAEWALGSLDTTWKPVIERALSNRRQNGNSAADPGDIRDTLALMRYALEQVHPTPLPDVNHVLHLLLQEVRKILGEQFVGMYLYGSLSSGDFDPETSDIDFLVVTSDELPEETISALESMHNATWATSLRRAGQLEGAYVPQEVIRRHDPGGPPCPTVNEGSFYRAPLGSDWIIQRHVVREYGVVVAGPDPKTLIDPVSPDEIRAAVKGVLKEWWFPMLEDPSWLREHDNAYRAFAVITMCRVLHALAHGTIVSKPKAIQWARGQLDDRWITLIDQAVAASHHVPVDDLLEETLAFIRFVQEQT